RFSRDWSSDVCSSDLDGAVFHRGESPPCRSCNSPGGSDLFRCDTWWWPSPSATDRTSAPDPRGNRLPSATGPDSSCLHRWCRDEIGRASCREGVDVVV